MRRVLPVALLGLILACDGELTDPPSEARIVLFEVQDPVLDPAAIEPATILWLSTRSGRAWVATTDGRALGDHQSATGGAVIRSEIWPADLEPGDNHLEVHLAPDSGEDPLRAALVISVAAGCTRQDHCPGGRCVDFYCE